ncbi:pseudouridine synthase [Corynebacterium kutscheri]|nr:pseudouridine synthase [Corynebacterium kutscheri]
MTLPMPVEKNSRIGFTIALISMSQRVIQLARKQAPLAVKDGLNPSRVRVPAEADGLNAKEFVHHLINSQRHRHPEDNEHALHKRFDDQEVIAVRGHRARILTTQDQVYQDEDVWFYRIPAPEPVIPYDIPILFEDDHLLVVNKPPFYATMPRGKHITNSVTTQLRRLTENGELSPAHRLDRLTSGVLVFTKTREVRGAYQTLFAKREVHKTYQAIARFNNQLQAGSRWCSRLEKNAGEHQTRILDGKPNAITTVVSIAAVSASRQTELKKIFGAQPQLASYILAPETGRTHQLRVHMYQAGTPILGDPVYPIVLPEEVEDYRIPLCLCAVGLSFIDPISGVDRIFETESLFF